MRKVYIGDPCYVFKDETWSQICDMIDESYYFNNAGFDWLLITDKRFFIAKTAYGDGSYSLKNHKNQKVSNISVDSGTIACIDFEMLSDFEQQNALDAHKNNHAYITEIQCYDMKNIKTNHDCFIDICTMSIDTKNDDYDDYDDSNYFVNDD
jgi:hypothetical protein